MLALLLLCQIPLPPAVPELPTPVAFESTPVQVVPEATRVAAPVEYPGSAGVLESEHKAAVPESAMPADAQPQPFGVRPVVFAARGITPAAGGFCANGSCAAAAPRQVALSRATYSADGRYVLMQAADGRQYWQEVERPAAQRRGLFGGRFRGRR